MQNRPILRVEGHDGIELVYAPIELSSDFPVSYTRNGTHVPESSPLTYLHSHDALEIGCCYEGSGIFVVEDKTLPFSKGDVSVIFRNEFHLAQSHAANPSHWVFLTLDPVRLLQEMDFAEIGSLGGCLDGAPGFQNIVRGNGGDGLAVLVREIIEEAQNETTHYRSALKGLVLCLLVRIHRALSDLEPAERRTAPTRMKRLAPAMDRIFKEYSTHLPVPVLARSCCMSVTHFRRTFKTALGNSPQDYLARFRIRMATLLLYDTRLKVVDISLQCGFDSVSSFNRHFRAVMGMTPRGWRATAGVGR
jgi:AraC-like DNA-binding protein